jgi:hypothetical protein
MKVIGAPSFAGYPCGTRRTQQYVSSCQFVVTKNYVSKPLSDLRKLKLAHGFKRLSSRPGPSLVPCSRFSRGCCPEGPQHRQQLPKGWLRPAVSLVWWRLVWQQYRLGASEEVLIHAAGEACPHGSLVLFVSNTQYVVWACLPYLANLCVLLVFFVLRTC